MGIFVVIMLTLAAAFVVAALVVLSGRVEVMTPALRTAECLEQQREVREATLATFWASHELPAIIEERLKLKLQSWAQRGFALELEYGLFQVHVNPLEHTIDVVIKKVVVYPSEYDGVKPDSDRLDAIIAFLLRKLQEARSPA